MIEREVKRMRRIFLQKIRQGPQEAYAGTADPRLLNELIIHEEKDDEKYQRAISSSRVAEIARYVKGEEGAPPGILPGSLILGTRYPDRLQVRSASALIRDETGRQDDVELVLSGPTGNPGRNRLPSGDTGYYGRAAPVVCVLAGKYPDFSRYPL